MCVVTVYLFCFLFVFVFCLIRRIFPLLLSLSGVLDSASSPSGETKTEVACIGRPARVKDPIHSVILSLQNSRRNSTEGVGSATS